MAEMESHSRETVRTCAMKIAEGSDSEPRSTNLFHARGEGAASDGCGRGLRECPILSG